MDKDTSKGENDTHIYDWSGNGNNGSVVGIAKQNSLGKFGGSFEFFGNVSNNYINVNAGPSLNTWPR